MTKHPIYDRQCAVLREARLCFLAPPPGGPELPRPSETPPPGERPAETIAPDAIDGDVNTHVNEALNAIRERVTKPLVERAINSAYAAIIARGTSERDNPRITALVSFLSTPRGREAFAAAVQRNLERRSVRGYRVTVAPDNSFRLTPQTETISAPDAGPVPIERMPARFQNLARRYADGMRNASTFPQVERDYIENTFMQQGLTINENGTATPAQGSFGRGLVMLVGLFRGLAWEMENSRNSRTIRTRLEGSYTPRDAVAEHNANPNRLADIAISAPREVAGTLRPGETGSPRPRTVRDVTLTPRTVSGQTPEQIGSGLSRALTNARVEGVSVAAGGVVTVREVTTETLRTISNIMENLATPDSSARTEVFRAGKERTLRDLVSGKSLLPEADRANIQNAIELRRGTDGKYTAVVNMNPLKADGAMPPAAITAIEGVFTNHNTTTNERSTPALEQAQIDPFIQNLRTRLG